MRKGVARVRLTSLDALPPTIRSEPRLVEEGQSLQADPPPGAQ
jgi:hypothetical protein